MHLDTAYASARSAACRGAGLLAGALLALGLVAPQARAEEPHSLTPFSAAAGAVPPAP